MTLPPSRGGGRLAMLHREWPFSPARLVIGSVLAACVVLGTLAAAIPQADGPHEIRQLDVWGGVLVLVAVSVTLMLRRTHPVRGLAAAMVVVNGYLLVGYPYGPVQLCIVVAMYEVARRQPLSRSLLICGVAAVVTSVTVYARLTHDVATPWLLALAWTGWLVVPWLLGALVQTVRASRERTRRHLLAQGAMEERMKLAAEVHDVAGHGFALIAMQAGVALLDFEKPDQVRRSLEAIQTTSTKSLTDLRGMLSTVHQEPSLAVPADPVTEQVPLDSSERVGLCGLVDLVEQVRAGGLPIRLQMRDLSRSLDGETDAAAYRVVQESLTNVLRHAGPTTAEVSITQNDDWLLVEVGDGGRGHVGEPHGAGRGLAGMRRRVEAVGGVLTVGPRDGGGFRVEACLPMSKGSE